MFKRIKNLFSGKLSETHIPPLVIGDESPTSDEWEQFFHANPSITYAAVIGHPVMRHAINMISSLIACLTANQFKKTTNGRIKEQDSIAYFLLNKAPNDYDCSITLIRQWIAYFLVFGKSAIYINRSGAKPLELHLLDPWNWQIGVDPINNVPVYSVKTPEGWLQVPVYDLLILRDFGEVVLPYSLMAICRKQMELSHSLTEYALEFFRSGGLTGTADVHFNGPQYQNEDLRKAVLKEIKANQAKRWRSLPPGVEITYNTTDNDKSQMVQSQENDRKNIASLWGMPANFLNAEINSSYKSLEELRSVRLEALNWILLQMEREYNRKLLTTADFRSGNRYIELARDEILELDRKTQQEMILDLYHGDVISWEETREKLNMHTDRDEKQRWVHETSIVPEEDATMPIPPQTPQNQVETPQNEPKQVDNQPPTPQELGISILAKVKNRLLKSIEAGKTDVMQHKNIITAQLSSWNNAEEFTDTFLSQLQKEIDAVLPEERISAIERIDPKELICKLK